MARLRTTILLTGYCLFLFLAFDFVYTAFIFGRPSVGTLRTSDPRYSHGLTANFDGVDRWGPISYKFYTNNLGFRDGSVRNVSAKPTVHRTLLIGDSFTEAVGVSFEESFAGLLYRAGQERNDKVEFLNAGVQSYSPTLYYKKIKTLLESGLTFDEVVVFLDLSDIVDEATTYFCFDDDPRYDAHKRNCRPTDAPVVLVPPPKLSVRDRLGDYFVVTRGTLAAIDSWRHLFRDPEQRLLRTDWMVIRSTWTIPTSRDLSKFYAPLGIDGGIVRARNNMQALADLLRQHRIALTVVTYPYPVQLAMNDRSSRQSAIWREFCATNCTAFIDAFPAFFTFKDAHKDWIKQLYIEGDIHYSAAGNRLLFEVVADRLLNAPKPSAAPASGAARAP